MAAPVCVITGVGPGNGLAFTRTFAAHGYRVAMLARGIERLRDMAADIPEARAYGVDVTDIPAVGSVFEQIRRDLGPVTVLIHNAGSGTFGAFLHTTPEQLEESWRTNVLALLLCGQEAARDMLAAGSGTIVVIGATASLRGGANFAAFAAAKAAQRSLAQSMARGLGSLGVHVAHVVIDGVIDTPRARQMMPDRPDDFFLNPDHIADSVFHLVGQPRSAWTFEIDLRPSGERW